MGPLTEPGPRTVWEITYGWRHCGAAPETLRKVLVLAETEAEARSASRYYRKNYERLVGVADTGVTP